MTLSNSSKATLGGFLALIIGLIFLGSCGGGSSSTGTSNNTTPATNNSVALTVGNTFSDAYVNGIYTSVTICAPGSSNCQTVDNVLVDTGSVGLRILSSALTTVPPSSLGSLTDSSGDALQECVQYGDTSYTWGPMLLGDVELAGEKASTLPIQVIGSSSAGVPSQCLATPVLAGYGNDDTVAALGANGILGVAGGYPVDCGSACTSSTYLTSPGYFYYICPTGQACSATTAPLADQATNPVAAFSSSDNNGVLITLPNVSATGAASVTGSLIFGIGTQSNNALVSTATVYGLDEYGYIPQVTYNGIDYISPYNLNILDTGSNAIYFSDASTLASAGIIECADNPGYYCPSGTVSFSVSATWANSTSGTLTFSIANADTLLSSPNWAFSNLGGDGGTSPSNDSVDLGLPFFYGKTVYVGMWQGVFTGETAPPSAATSATNGYYAF